VNNSQNVEIVGNVVEAINANPICMTNSVRFEPPIFPQSLGNVSVHGNTFKTRGPVAIGMVGETVPPGISFTGNTYLMDDLARAVWAYGTYPLGRLQWQGKGQDQAGVFKTW